MISNLEHLGKLPIQTGAVWLQKSYFEHCYQTHPLPLNQASLAQILSELILLCVNAVTCIWRGARHSLPLLLN